MCKHKHTTETNTLTEWGEIHIHQCDMCGVCVPEKEVEGVSSVPFDEQAARVGYRRGYEKIVKLAEG